MISSFFFFLTSTTNILYDKVFVCLFAWPHRVRSREKSFLFRDFINKRQLNDGFSSFYADRVGRRKEATVSNDPSEQTLRRVWSDVPSVPRSRRRTLSNYLRSGTTPFLTSARSGYRATFIFFLRTANCSVRLKINDVLVLFSSHFDLPSLGVEDTIPSSQVDEGGAVALLVFSWSEGQGSTGSRAYRDIAKHT